MVPAVYPRGWAPSLRFRVEQFIPYLEKAGFEIRFSEGMSVREYQSYRHSKYVAARVLARQLWQRLKDVFRVRRYDAVWIQREAWFLPWAWPEKWFARHVPVIYDIDDAIWLPQPDSTFTLRQRKIPALVRLARLVLTCNPLIAEHIQQWNTNVHLLPSVVPVPEKLTIQRPDRPIRIGWLGSDTTYTTNFLPFIEIFDQISELQGIELWISTLTRPQRLPRYARWVPYHPDREQEFLQQIHIGLAPLPDDVWNRHKCSLKVVSYMAHGVVPVASAVGIHSLFIRHGEEGFLVRKPAEWVEAITRLANYPDVWQRLAHNAYQRALSDFSVQGWAPRLADWFHKAIQNFRSSNHMATVK